MSLALWEAQKLEESLQGRFELVEWRSAGSCSFRGKLEGYEVSLKCGSKENSWSLHVSGCDVSALNMSSHEAAINAVVAQLADGISLRTRAIKALTGVQI